MTSFERNEDHLDQAETSDDRTNIVALPRVKDLTQAESRITVETDGSGIYDLLLTIWAMFDSENDLSTFELGQEWFSEVAGSLPDDLRGELDFLGGSDAWLSLAGLVATSPYPHDIDSVLAWLGRIDPLEIRTAILTHKCGGQLDAASAALAERAAGGDAGALDQLMAEGKLSARPQAAAAYRELMALPMPELRDRLVAALGRFRSEVYSSYEMQFSQATSRAAAARRALSRGAHPEKVIEDVTNGLDYRIQPGVTRLVLVPSVLLRPWAVIDQHRQTLTVMYAVADEFLNADPDAPPSWVVKLHKALGDERRLRILRRLSEGGASLDDLTEMLGLTKSTVHHHVGLLRAAGLIRVSLDPLSSNRHYALRPAVLPEARRTLDDYLGNTEQTLKEQQK